MQAHSNSSSALNKNKKQAKQSRLDDLLPMLEENFFEEVDKDQLDRTIQQIQEDRFFQREFAKDLKKFQAAGIRLDDGKPKARTKRNDLIDSFIDGDVKLDDVITRLHEKGKATVRDNKRISEMLTRKRSREKLH
jgi:Rps23 Pro-64 3,4-dihydroxylase Tpa1-like proline 4-hydroxylase